MNSRILVAKAVLLLGLISASLLSGCIVAEPRDGYYDRGHHRYYHEHAWIGCREEDVHCR